jgi:magnesium transporter
LYVSSLSMRTNDIMRVLTIVSSIFIPLTFIAGLYGMNFAHMPELHWRFGYPFVLFLMGAVAGGMILFFKRKNWL